MGRTPAEGAEGYWEGGLQIRRSWFQQLPWFAENSISKKTPKGEDQSTDPTHPRGQIENATAPSAGGSPDPDAKAANLFGQPQAKQMGQSSASSDIV